MDLPFLPNDENQCGFHIGAGSCKGDDHFFDGDIKEVSFYSYVVPASELNTFMQQDAVMNLFVPPTVSVGGSTMLLQQQIYMPFADSVATTLNVFSCSTLGCSDANTAASNAPPCILNTKSPSENINGVCWVYFLPSGQYHIGPGECVSMTNATCSPGQQFESPSAVRQISLKGSTIDDGTCSNCPVGRYKSVEQPTSCSMCPLGYSTANNTSSIHCTPCAPGFYGTDSIGFPLCAPCPAGTYNPNAASVNEGACLVCAAGTFTNRTGTSTECSPCRPGTNLVDDATKPTAHDHEDDCQLCPVLSYNPLEGLDDDCYPCLTARTTGAETCEGCDPGMYRMEDEHGNTSCVVCKAGTFTNNRNQGACKSCVKGQYAPQNGTVVCLLCPRGKYGVDVSAGAKSLTEGCTDCPRGTFSDIDGLSSVSNCTACAAGFGVRHMASTKSRYAGHARPENIQRRHRP